MPENEIIAGRYELGTQLGKGGVGAVYAAFDRKTRNKVAVKILSRHLPNSEEFCRRFEAEAKALTKVKHPNVVEVLEAGSEGDAPYMVMEYIEGTQLDHVIADRPDLPMPLKLSYARQLCEGLQALHDGKIVHRNIKPGNVLVRPDDSVKLLDSGIARIVDSDSVTKSNMAIGTLFYMSPEQVKGELVDARADIFSTGIVLYQLLTRDVPWKRDTEYKVFSQIIGEPHAPLSAHIQDYPKALDGILDRAMAKQAADRYQNAREMAAALAEVEKQCAAQAAPAAG